MLMKRSMFATFGLVLSVFLAVIVLIYGGRIITQRHRVAEIAWILPTNQVAEFSESLILEGVDRALRSGSYDPSLWKPVLTDRRRLSQTVLSGRKFQSGLIIISNEVAGRKLFGRMELNVLDRTVKVAIYRPK